MVDNIGLKMIDWECQNGSCKQGEPVPLETRDLAIPLCPKCGRSMQPAPWVFTATRMKKRGVKESPSDAATRVFMDTMCKLDDIPNPAIRPAYYKGREVMDFINRFKLSFCIGTALKYMVRYREKNGVEDLKKANWYLLEEIRIMEEDIESQRVGGGNN